MNEEKEMDEIIIAFPEITYLGDNGILGLQKVTQAFYEFKMPFKEAMIHNLPRRIYGDNTCVVDRIIIQFKKRADIDG